MEGYTEMISYKYDVAGITATDLEPFFDGWSRKPDPDKRMRILNNSDHVIIAMDENIVVGFVNALTDKTISAYIPLLEVIPEYRNRGIGSELIQRMIKLLGELYMIDISCDKDLEKFYRKLGFTALSAMVIRNYDKI